MKFRLLHCLPQLHISRLRSPEDRAVPRKGQAALPLVQLAYDRDNPSPNKSHNQIEQDALLALLVGALPPMGVRASRGLGRHQGLPSIGQA